MKVAKIVIANFIILVFLFGLTEIFCRINNSYHFFNLTRNSSSLPKSFTPITASDYGPEVLRPIPLTNISSVNPHDLSKYKYEDIDQTPLANRVWTPSSDQQTVSSRFIKKIKGTDIKLYDIELKLNSFGYRNVENQNLKKNAHQFIIAAGDSFTSGEGVNQGLEYPSQLAALTNNDWKIYNYGFSGASANDFTARVFNDPNLFNQVTEPSGDFIWLYSEVQMQRLVLPTNSYKKADYILLKPEFTLEDGQVYYHGLFKDNQRLARKAISFFSQFEIVNSFNIEIPKLYTEKNYRLFFALLNLSISTIESHGKRVNRKIVINYFSQQNDDDFTRVAKENGFIVLDIQRLLDFKNTKQNVKIKIPVDGHPTSEAYWLLANALKYKFY